jgi:perosamine synthetase
MKHKPINLTDVPAPYGPGIMPDKPGIVPFAFPRVMSTNCIKYLREVIEGGLNTDMVERFEKAFAEALGVKHCIAAPGCTPALSVLAAALPFEPGDEIIVSPVTDFGTIQGLCRENYIPVFPDTDAGTLKISAETIAPCITDRTRAILVVHMTGIICDMDGINQLAEKHGLFVYEDACQAIFGKYNGRLIGTLSQATTFSFDAEKTMGSDYGGCVVTNDDELAHQMRFIGQSRGALVKPGFGRVHTECGYAYRMSQSTAAISLAQLEIIRDQVANRDRMIRLIHDKLAAIPGIIPLEIPSYMDVYSCWMAGFSIKGGAFRCTAEEFGKQMHEKGISGAGLMRYYLMPEAAEFLQVQAGNKIYPFSIPPASHRYSYSADQCPNANRLLKSFIRWIISESYEEKHCDLIEEVVSEIAEQNRLR